VGKLSDKRRAAQRPGRRERARVKRRIRGSISGTVGGVYTYTIVAGRQKLSKVYRFVDSLVQGAHLGGEPATPKLKGDARRPLYTVSPCPLTLLSPNVLVSGPQRPHGAGD
jgi:hypothetical protein